MGVLDGDGYYFTRDQLEALLITKHFPERSQWEDRILLDYLMAHAHEFDGYTFSKRVGEGIPPNPEHLPGTQAQTTFNTKRRIDLLAWSGSRLTIHEVKKRATPSALGQLLNYRNLLLAEMPDAEEPALVVLCEAIDPDALELLTGIGVTVYAYPAAEAP